MHFGAYLGAPNMVKWGVPETLETLGRAGWKVLAETLKMRPNLVMMLGISKREMEEADWEAVGEFIGLRGSCSLYCEEDEAGGLGEVGGDSGPGR